MINFKEQDGMLFKMLDKPVPLTDDTKLPVLVQLIQDDSRLGILNKLLHEGCYHEKYLCTSCNHHVCHILINGEEYDDFYPKYEIIGYPVEEGSKDWALHQMTQGEKVCHKKSPSIMYCKRDSKIMREVRCGCVDFMSIDAWLNGADKSGWQIYEEPKPTFKVGDWVDCKDPAGVPAQCKVLEIRKHNVILECTTGHIWSLPHNNIIRKLSPSEIIVTIGCLSGTIAKSCDPNYFLMLHSRPATDCNHSMIRFSAIDTETRSLVESLLKAQGEESQ